MSAAAVLDVLTYAQAHLRPVRLVLRDGSEVAGTPSTVDPHPAALEVFLHPAGDDDTEIGVTLTAIAKAELL